jgi:hypothetical protein
VAGLDLVDVPGHRHVVGHFPTGVPEHLRVAEFEPEHLLDRDPLVHARDHEQPLVRRDPLATPSRPVVVRVDRRVNPLVERPVVVVVVLAPVSPRFVGFVATSVGHPVPTYDDGDGSRW